MKPAASAAPTHPLEALLVAPPLWQNPCDVLKIVVAFARSPVEVAADAWTEHFRQMKSTAPEAWGPLPAAPALALLPNGAVQPEVQAYFDGLSTAGAEGGGRASDRPGYFIAVRKVVNAYVPLMDALARRGDWVHLLLLAVYGMPRQVYIDMVGWESLAKGLLPGSSRDCARHFWLPAQYRRLRP